jgi:teichuronic acid biosynthesis protein TuaE
MVLNKNWFYKNIETLRVVSIIAITTLVCFNVLHKAINIFFLGCLIVLFLLFYFIGNTSYGIVNTKKNELFFIGWLIFAVLQTTWTDSTDRTWLYIMALALGVIVIWFMSRLIVTKKWLDTLYSCWGFALLGTILIGLWEIITNNHFSGSGAGASHYNLQNVATVGFFNPNDYSFFLVISLPIIFYWFKQKMIYKLLGLFMFASAFYIISQNVARFSVFLFIITTAFFLISFVRDNKRFLDFIINTNKKILNFLFVANKRLLIIFIIASMLVFLYYRKLILQTMDGIISLLQSDESSSIRKLLFENGLSIFIDHPLGIGSGNIDNYMKQNGLAVNNITVLHNYWLEILVTYGIIIFIGFVIFFVLSLYKMREVVLTSESLRPLITPVLWSSFIFIPASLQSSTIFTFNVTWFLFGTIICAVNIIEKETKMKHK